MKIRFRKNTIRYRLDQIDVKHLNERGFCEEKINVPPSGLIFSLNISEKNRNRNAIVFDLSRLKLEIQSALIVPVIQGSQTGFECQIQGTGDSVLEIIVEKDFKCLAPRGDEDVNSFDNPLQDGAVC